MAYVCLFVRQVILAGPRFLIQNTQNGDSSAVLLKLDELICSIKEADNKFLDAEELDE